MLTVHFSFILELYFIKGRGDDTGSGGVWLMHLVYVARHLEVGVVSGEQSRAGREKYDTQQEEESHNRIPAEDDFQLAAVQLAPVRQAHDALLVASQVLCVHIHLVFLVEVS